MSPLPSLCQHERVEGSSTQAMNALEEITERVLQKAAVLGKFIEAIPVAFLVVDPKSAIYMVNRQAELLFGYDQSEMIGQTVELLVPEIGRAHV